MHSHMHALVITCLDEYEHTFLNMLLMFECNMLGSKTLGLNVLKLQFVMLVNHDQNVQSCFRLAQSMLKCKVGIEYTARFTV